MNLLDTVYLHVTKACNLQCIYCYFSAGKPMGKELATEEMVLVLQDIRLLRPKRVVFTGGEPLLRRDIIELVELCKSIGFKGHLCITTNGTLINDINVQGLVHNFHEIRISIDGPEEINDAMRGKGSFQKVMRAFEYVLKAGGDPIAFIAVTSLNLPHLKRFMGYLLSNGVSNIHISPLKLAGRADDETMLGDLEAIKRMADEFWRETFGLRLKNHRKEAFNCGVGRFLTVYPDGHVYPCHLLAFPEFCIGNVREQKLRSIYNDSQLMNKLKGLHFSEIAQCADCFQELTQAETCLGSVMREETSRRQLLDVLSERATM